MTSSRNFCVRQMMTFIHFFKECWFSCCSTKVMHLHSLAVNTLDYFYVSTNHAYSFAWSMYMYYRRHNRFSASARELLALIKRSARRIGRCIHQMQRLFLTWLTAGDVHFSRRHALESLHHNGSRRYKFSSRGTFLEAIQLYDVFREVAPGPRAIIAE